jgi:hypothetical protein
MKMVLVGALGILALQVVLVLGAYAARIPPEVVDCDRGRRSVEVRVTNVSLDRDKSVARRELGPCKLWYHANP